MSENDIKKLLKNEKVVEEIERHRWFESEKLGKDIGFEKASEEWFNKFAQAWIDYHLPTKSPKKRNK